MLSFSPAVFVDTTLDVKTRYASRWSKCKFPLTLSTLSVIADAGHKHHLLFINQAAPSYRTWFGMVKAPAATRPLADYELEALQKILGLR